MCGQEDMQWSHIRYKVPPPVADREFSLGGGGSGGGLKGGLTIGQHPQPSSDYEEDYVIGKLHGGKCS